MFTELFLALVIFAVVFLLLFRSNLSPSWKHLVQKTVTAVLLVWLLTVGWVTFSDLLAPAVGPKLVKSTLEQTRVENLIQLITQHPRAKFYVAPAGQPATFDIKGEVEVRNTNLTVNVTAYIDAVDMAAIMALTNVQVGFVHPSTTGAQMPTPADAAMPTMTAPLRTTHRRARRIGVTP
jgi:hypothetical protein